MFAPKPDIVITEFMDSSAVETLSQLHRVHYDSNLVDLGDKIYPLLENARALIVRNRTQVDSQLLARAPKLKVIGRLGVGLDNIDLHSCRQRNIPVHSATGANARAVAEYVLAMAFVTLRGAYGQSREVAAGHWPRAQLSAGREVEGKTLGLLGFGDIGRLTARLAAAIGLDVIAHDPHVAPGSPAWRETQVQPVSLAELLARADVLSLHLPLTEQSRGFFGRERILAMKRGAVLINTARGSIVDEQALAEAVKGGHLGGAAVDVFESEPLPAGSPLAGLPNVWLTPHIAGLTTEANFRVSRLIADKVADALAEEQVERHLCDGHCTLE